MFIGREEDVIKEAIAAMNNHGVVICPAFTIYGFSAFLWDIRANRKILRLKRRNENKPFIIIADKDFIMSKAKGANPEILEFLLDSSVSVVVETEAKMPFYASKRGKSAFRMANTGFLKQLVKHQPITSTSVNISGSNRIYSIQDIIKIFGGRVDGVVIGDVLGVPSTVVELCKNDVKLLRRGFNIEKIKEVVDGRFSRKD